MKRLDYVGGFLAMQAVCLRSLLAVEEIDNWGVIFRDKFYPLVPSKVVVRISSVVIVRISSADWKVLSVSGVGVELFF